MFSPIFKGWSFTLSVVSIVNAEDIEVSTDIGLSLFFMQILFKLTFVVMRHYIHKLKVNIIRSQSARLKKVQ